MLLLQLTQGSGSDHYLLLYGLVPAKFTDPQISAYFSTGQKLISLFTFMFLHGGFMHLIGNMWFLHIFGDNVEDRLGPARYAIFYLLCGLASGMTQLIFNASSRVPTIGASGAIAGVMGAYFILYPSSRILTLIPIIIIPWFVEIPAFFFIGIWFVLQVFNVAGSSGGAGGIAWWAHIGGFLFGILFLKLFDRIPATGFSNRLQQATERKQSHRFQVIKTTRGEGNTDLYGTLTITQYEAMVGARKTVTVPWGLQNRLYNIIVPQGITDGQILRLKGVGRPHVDGTRGDMLLKVKIQHI
ncbi:rhomboid family intramembrane serine protease [Desulfosarcina cetonica]|uniref:rhomboid family intramembrane serine protease n=1 Tax=Desulfosarcina cetonica TaxID=90730 RepID=UPI000B13C2D3|nr:rhomboid family intramembrane serine protease [Desulfosarcina cetonica]